MSTTLLARHPFARTSDLDEARRLVAQRFCDHRLEPTGRARRLDLVHNALALSPEVEVHCLRYGVDVHIEPGRFDDFFLVQIPLAGRADVRVGGRAVASDRTTASVGSPTEHVDMRWSADCTQLLVWIAREAVDGAAGAPVVFDPSMRLDGAAVRSWLRLVRLVVDEADRPGGVLASPAAGHLGQALLTGLLAAQPSTVTAASSVPLSSRAVRNALAAIEADPARVWRVAELAAASGTSTRTLQESFHRELGVSPLVHQRHLRLERVRAALQEAARDGSGDSVTTVALEWGFFHLGRFARHYADRFGELPHETLGDTGAGGTAS